MKKIVVFTGAGVSADSGLATFRDADGLWAEYRIEDVCTPEALARNRALVVEFYNRRRREMLDAGPNAGHRAIAALEERFEVEVITQNVDDLHERAGSTRVLHLHGELTCLRSERDAELIVPLDGWEQPLDARAPDGALLRPHIVFFGEAVPMFDRAARIAAEADIMVVVGTSLAVYPAASLVRYVRPEIPIFVVDPGRPDTSWIRNPLTFIHKRAADGVPELAAMLQKTYVQRCAAVRNERIVLPLCPGKSVANMTLFTFIEILGTLAFAISGIRLASAKRFDWFGAYVVGFTTAIGGGTVRDLMLSLTPFWMLDSTYLFVTAGALLIVIVSGPYLIRFNNTFFIFDAIGLGLFTVVGIEKTLAAGFPLWVGIIMGTITGAAGGVLRDILINEEPLIFRKEIYALACVFGGVVFGLCQWAGLGAGTTEVATALSVIAARVVAVHFGLKLPILK